MSRELGAHSRPQPWNPQIARPCTMPVTDPTEPHDPEHSAALPTDEALDAAFARLGVEGPVAGPLRRLRSWVWFVAVWDLGANLHFLLVLGELYFRTLGWVSSLTTSFAWTMCAMLSPLLAARLLQRPLVWGGIYLVFVATGACLYAPATFRMLGDWLQPHGISGGYHAKTPYYFLLYLGYLVLAAVASIWILRSWRRLLVFNHLLQDTEVAGAWLRRVAEDTRPMRRRVFWWLALAVFLAYRTLDWV